MVTNHSSFGFLQHDALQHLAFFSIIQGVPCNKVLGSAIGTIVEHLRGCTSHSQCNRRDPGLVRCWWRRRLLHQSEGVADSQPTGAPGPQAQGRVHLGRSQQQLLTWRAYCTLQCRQLYRELCLAVGESLSWLGWLRANERLSFLCFGYSACSNLSLFAANRDLLPCPLGRGGRTGASLAVGWPELCGACVVA